MPEQITTSNCSRSLRAEIVFMEMPFEPMQPGQTPEHKAMSPCLARTLRVLEGRPEDRLRPLEVLPFQEHDAEVVLRSRLNGERRTAVALLCSHAQHQRLL